MKPWQSVSWLEYWCIVSAFTNSSNYRSNNFAVLMIKVTAHVRMQSVFLRSLEAYRSEKYTGFVLAW